MSATQAPPRAGADLTGFPRRTVSAGARMYRAHSAGHSAWWFDNSAQGRFNLHGDRGTCCAASRLDTAVREKVRSHVSYTGLVSAVLARSFVVSTLTLPAGFACAAVSHADAVKHHVVRELVTMHDYTVPQAWAAAFDDAGFAGIFYASAFTTGAPSAYALFGAAGAPATAGFTAALAVDGAAACAALGWTVQEPSGRGIPLIR